MKKLPIIYIIAVCFIASVCQGEERNWTGKKQQIKAEYISCENGIVKLKTKSGKIYRISLSKLSESDQNFVVKTKGYAVINVLRQEGVKASLDIRLEKRVLKERLVEIAKLFNSRGALQDQYFGPCSILFDEIVEVFLVSL